MCRQSGPPGRAFGKFQTYAAPITDAPHIVPDRFDTDRVECLDDLREHSDNAAHVAFARFASAGLSLSGRLA